MIMDTSVLKSCMKKVSEFINNCAQPQLKPSYCDCG